MKTNDIYGMWETIPRADRKEALRELMHFGLFKIIPNEDRYMKYDGKTFAIVAKDGTVLEESRNPYDLLDKYIGYKRNIKAARPDDRTFYRFVGNCPDDDVDRPISDFQSEQEAIDEAIFSMRALYKVTSSKGVDSFELLYMDKDKALYAFGLISDYESPIQKRYEEKYAGQGTVSLGIL